jgi:RHS repeat-associated protein
LKILDLNDTTPPVLNIVTSLTKTTTTVLYDGDNAWLEGDSSGSIENWYLFGDTIDHNLARFDVDTNSASWYLADRLGSITTVANMSHTVLASAYYDSFGNTLQTTGNSTALGRYAFAGRELDASGLYNNRARSYNPSTGIFVQQDPIGFEAADVNLYRYVHNSGTNMRDPHGELALAEYRPLIVNFAVGFVACYFGNQIDPTPDNLGEKVGEFGIKVAWIFLATALFKSIAKTGGAATIPLAMGASIAGIGNFVFCTGA